MTPFIFNTSPSIQFGAGLLSQLGEIVKSKIGNRVLLVTDPGMMATGIVERAQTALKDANVEVTLFSDVQADPPEEVILQATQIAIDCGAEGIIGLGGGSSLDVGGSSPPRGTSSAPTVS